MIHEILRPIVRRGILDLILDIGGEQNDFDIALLLAELGHRVARVDVAGEITWLAARDLLIVKSVGPFLVARSTDQGRDCAMGRLRVDGVCPHKTGE